MESFDHVKRLAREGRFREALDALSLAGHSNHTDAEVLRAELLEKTGRLAQSLEVLRRLERVKDLNPSARSACAYVYSRIERDAGNIETARTYLQKSISFASAAGDLERTCFAQLPLALLLADQNGPEAATTLLAQVRSMATKLGNPHVSAALHLTVGELDAKRGLLNTAQHHTLLAKQLLKGSPSLWLETWAENNLVGMSIVRSDFAQAVVHGKRALDLAEESGASTRRLCLANLGNVFFATGDFQQAADYFERAASCLPSTGEPGNAMLESIARVSLALEKVDECAGLLNRIEQLVEPAARSLYVYRHSQLTKTRVLLRQGLLQEALVSAEVVLTLATAADDQLLSVIGRIAKAEVLRRMNKQREMLSLLTHVVSDLPGHSPDVYARYEGVFACALRSSRDMTRGLSHFERSQRIHRSLHSMAELQELTRSWDETTTAPHADASFATVKYEPSVTRAANLLQNVAALMMHAGRPELLATGVVAILEDTGAAAGASAVSRADDGTVEILSAYGDQGDTPSGGADPPHVMALGTARNRSVEVIVRPHSDIESVATLNAVTLLLGTIRDLERGQAEREERLTLWPIEDLPIDGEQAVIGGCLRELISFARRVARTNVSVLITGESGTGKEILARAVHGYSARAEKAFIPFNCTAVPRELLESQLFGYRRGAFTGADRDNPGLIRAAKGGTLFLDEIGELGIDLQPKLLRFLESGEISPLGESPLTVDVRIVAATNRNLEQLVEEGRFREDLYYRLNVIRLTIPPLRDRRDEIPALVHHFVLRAAGEFAKGRLRIAEETMEHLLLYPWPGNVRQLHNEIRRMAALADVDAVLRPAALSQEIRRATAKTTPRHAAGEIAVPLGEKLAPTLSRIEREMIRVALRTHEGRVEGAARALGISRKGLYLKRQRLGL